MILLYGSFSSSIKYDFSIAVTVAALVAPSVFNASSPKDYPAVKSTILLCKNIPLSCLIALVTDTLP
jgi:hypothetical protein